LEQQFAGGILFFLKNKVKPAAVQKRENVAIRPIFCYRMPRNRAGVFFCRRSGGADPASVPKKIHPASDRAAMGLVKKKICLLGAFAVGKTSLTERLVHGRFEEKYLTSVGVKISQKLLPPILAAGGGRSAQHTFLIWDIAGLEKFDHVADNYFRGASGALAVADLTRPETIEELKRFAARFRAVNPEAKLVLIGNKLDLFDEERGVLARLERLARDYATGSILTSAKSGARVEEAFLELSRKIEGFS
jgi:small GTP-binding protein